MITKFSEGFNFETEYNCTSVGIQTVKDISKEFRVYIPNLMPNIKKGKGVSISTVRIKGYTIFKNASSCRPKLSGMTLKEQNYITGTLENNSSLDNKLNSTGGISHGTKFRCKFNNSKLSKLKINTD